MQTSLGRSGTKEVEFHREKILDPSQRLRSLYIFGGQRKGGNRFVSRDLLRGCRSPGEGEKKRSGRERRGSASGDCYLKKKEKTSNAGRTTHKS